MTQFHEGQEVEVSKREMEPVSGKYATVWRKAKIEGMHGDKYLVKFADGTYSDFNADHIRPNFNDRLRASNEIWETQERDGFEA